MNETDDGGEAQRSRKKQDLKIWFGELCFYRNGCEKPKFISLHLTEGHLSNTIAVFCPLRILLRLQWSPSRPLCITEKTKKQKTFPWTVRASVICLLFTASGYLGKSVHREELYIKPSFKFYLLEVHEKSGADNKIWAEIPETLGTEVMCCLLYCFQT